MRLASWVGSFLPPLPAHCLDNKERNRDKDCCNPADDD